MTLNLDFNGHNTLYARHGLYAFAAKCPSQLMCCGVETYSQVGDQNVSLTQLIGPCARTQ